MAFLNCLIFVGKENIIIFDLKNRRNRRLLLAVSCRNFGTSNGRRFRIGQLVEKWYGEKEGGWAYILFQDFGEEEFKKIKQIMSHYVVADETQKDFNQKKIKKSSFCAAIINRDEWADEVMIALARTVSMKAVKKFAMYDGVWHQDLFDDAMQDVALEVTRKIAWIMLDPATGTVVSY